MAKKPTPHTPTREEFFASLTDEQIDSAFTQHYTGAAVLDGDDLRDYAKERQRRLTAGTWTGLPVGGDKGGDKGDEQKPDEARGADGLTDAERETWAAVEAERKKTEDAIRANNAAAIKAALAKGSGVAPAPTADPSPAVIEPELVEPEKPKQSAPSSFIAEGRKLNFGPG
jgi:hypothetical protein